MKQLKPLAEVDGVESVKRTKKEESFSFIVEQTKEQKKAARGK